MTKCAVAFALTVLVAMTASCSAKASHGDVVDYCMRSCRVMDGREWSKVPRSETPCADEITAWPRPESYLACKDGYTAGAVLSCQMGCHSIACKEISTRWRRVASTMDEVCGPWAGALPRPKMRYKCEMAYESSFRAGCEYGTDLLARTLARVAEKAAQEEQKEVIPEVEQVVDDEEPEAAVAEAATPVPPPVAEAEQVVEEEEGSPASDQQEDGAASPPAAGVTDAVEEVPESDASVEQSDGTNQEDAAATSAPTPTQEQPDDSIPTGNVVDEDLASFV